MRCNNYSLKTPIKIQERLIKFKKSINREISFNLFSVWLLMQQMYKIPVSTVFHSAWYRPDILLTQKQINTRDVMFMNNLNLLNGSLHWTMEIEFQTVESCSFFIVFFPLFKCIDILSSFAFLLRWSGTGKGGEAQKLKSRWLHAWQDTRYKH